MRISAKVDYAVRAMVELAANAADAGNVPVKGDHLARAQRIPVNFLENILGELRRAGLVASQRGADGGYWLAVPPEQIHVAEIIRAVEGPLADVHGTAPEKLDYSGPAVHLRPVWIATRANLRAVLEQVSLADIAAGRLPDAVTRVVADPDAWDRR